jgi:RNA polymerase sigma factor (sigma-70 family)
MRTDRELVAELLDGGARSLGAVFERYGDRIHDYCWSILRSPHDAADITQETFLLAAERVGQLRDPDKLRPWLYAIARSECLRRMRDRSTPVDDLTYLSEDDTTSLPAEQAELASLVQEAAAGLDPRDRAVLDLQLRHGLEGEELADALGVKASHAYVLVGRVRSRVERSLIALLVARRGRKDCEELAALLRTWDGSLSPLLRKRVARHIYQCDTCERTKAAVASPLALLGAVPFVPAPAQLRARLVSHVSDGADAADSSSDGVDSSGDGSTVDGTTGPMSGGRPSGRGRRWQRDGFPAPSRSLVRGTSVVDRLARAAVLILLAAALTAGLWPAGDRSGALSVAETTVPPLTGPPADGEEGAVTTAEVASPDANTSTTAGPSTTTAPTTDLDAATTGTSTSTTTLVGPTQGAGEAAAGSSSTTTTTTTSTSTTTTTAVTAPDGGGTGDGLPSVVLVPPTLFPPIRFDLIGPEILDEALSRSTIAEAASRSCFPTTARLTATVTDMGTGVDEVWALVSVGALSDRVVLTLADDPADGDDPKVPDDLYEGIVGPFPAGTVGASGSAGVVIELFATDQVGNESATRLVAKLVPC